MSSVNRRGAWRDRLILRYLDLSILRVPQAAAGKGQTCTHPDPDAARMELAKEGRLQACRHAKPFHLGLGIG